MAQLMPLPLTVSCFSKIQIGFSFLVPAHPGSPGQRAVKRVCACVCYLVGLDGGIGYFVRLCNLHLVGRIKCIQLLLDSVFLYSLMVSEVSESVSQIIC